MRFLIDAQLPPALVQWLVDKGHTADHVIDVLLADADDADVWNFAREHHAVIITKDEDFAKRAARTVVAPSIVWLRIGNATNRILHSWLEARWPAISALLDEGNRLIEVR